MADDLPDLLTLRLLVAVAETGSVAAAAAAVGLAQPTASERITRLESRVGVPLLTRSPAGSAPTISGARVVSWARELLTAAEGFQRSLADLGASGGEVVRLAASYTIAEHLVPGWLASFGRPLGGGVDLRVQNSAGVTHAVRVGEVHLGFIEAGTVPEGLHAEVIGHDELVAVTWPGHTWARRREPLEARHLVEQPLVLREVGSGTRVAFVDALAAAGLPGPRVEMQLGSNTAVVGAVLGRVAPAVLSRLAVRSHLESGTLVAAPVAGLDLQRPLHAVWAGAQPTGPAGRLLAHVRG